MRINYIYINFQIQERNIEVVVFMEGAGMPCPSYDHPSIDCTRCTSMSPCPFLFLFFF